MLDQRLRDAAQGVTEALSDLSPPPDLELTARGRRHIRLRRRPVLVAVSVFASTLLLLGVVPLLLSSDDSTVDRPRDLHADGGNPLVAPLDEVQGLDTSGGLWVWDSDGNVAGRVLSHWSSIPALSNPVIDVAEYDGTLWAITTNRCDPSVADYEGVGCATTLWRLDGQIWEPFPALNGLQLPDNLEDIEFDSAGTLWLIASDGALYTWNGDEATIVADAGLNNDGISITADGAVWASRFNPYFPDDIGLARFDDQIGAFQPVNPGDSGNHHAVMTTTPNDDLWVWLSAFPSASDFSDGTLAYYDSTDGTWTTPSYEPPRGSVRAMAADGEHVWLAVNSGSNALWRFDGTAWTRVTTNPEAEILDVGVAPDGTVWYVEDNVLKEVEQ